mgnify:CR=1 FL=1
MKLDRSLSDRTEDSIDVNPRDCWHNAWLALICLQLHSALYVEGWAVADGLLIEHAWIEVADRIVDPTLWRRQAAYFPGMRLDRRAARRALARCTEAMPAGCFPIVWRYGWRGTACPEYMAAYRAALAHAAQAAVIGS